MADTPIDLIATLTPEQAYAHLVSQLSPDNQRLLDIIYAATAGGQLLGYIDEGGLNCLRHEGRAMVWRDPSERTIPFFAQRKV